MSTVINSANFISSHWLAWKAVGATFTEVNWLGLYGLYACIHHLAVTVGFPLHLGVKLFRNDTVTDDIMNLTIFLETFSSSLKIIIFAFKLRKVRHMEKLLKLLDARVQGWAQHNIYDELRKRLKKLIYAYIGVCAVVIMFSEISFLFQSERKLQHPAWFPFDYTNSTYKYYIAHVYQTYGGAMQLVQNYANACFPAVMLCIISAHIQMLYKRIEDIGMANESAQDSEADLEACITDHKHLLELFNTIESFISWPMLIQFVASALNICISIASVVFYVTEPLQRLFFLAYALALPLEIFPTCYYSTDIEFWFGQLHSAAFSCNWLCQPRSFKRKLMLFVERSLKQTSAKAGGMLLIHLNTFMGTLKFAYSFFNIILQLHK